MFEVVELAEQCRKAAGADVVLATDAELLAAAVEFAGARAAFDAAEAHVLAQLEGRGVCERDFGLRTGSWVAAETHAPRTVCRARVRMGTQIRRLCLVDQALSEGRIGLEHARAIVDAVSNPRVGDRIVELEGDLVDAAEHAPFEVWRSDLGLLLDLLDQDGGYDPDTDRDRNHFHARFVGNARLVFSGELVGEHALVVAQALNKKSDELFRRSQDDRDHCDDLEIPRRATLTALALTELCRLGLAHDPSGTKAPHCDITLVIHDETSTRTPGLFTIEGERLTTLERYQYLLCDASITALIVDSLGVPLDLGHTVRLATPAQRRALAIRDGGCVFPGCDAPVSWCDAHHVDWYEHGGPTAIHNLALLCRRHHGITHRHGWTMSAAPDQRFTWTTPTGRTLHSQRHLGRPPPRGER